MSFDTPRVNQRPATPAPFELPKLSTSLSLPALHLKEALANTEAPKKGERPKGINLSSSDIYKKGEVKNDNKEKVKFLAEVKVLAQALKVIPNQISNTLHVEAKAISHNRQLNNMKNNYDKIEKNLQNEIGETKDKIRSTTVTQPNELAKLTRLESLRNETISNPNGIKNLILVNQNESLFKALGPTKFLSALVFVNETVSRDETLNKLNLSDCEKVSLYLYTTDAFTPINSGLRKAAGNEVSDKDLKTIIDHMNSGLLKLPEPNIKPGEQLRRMITISPEEGNAPTVKERTDTWKKNNLLSGSYRDHAVGSASTAGGVPGAYRLMYKSSSGFKDIGPFSAFPKEAEFVALPGLRFNITKVYDAMNVEGEAGQQNVFDLELDMNNDRNRQILGRNAEGRS